jgi:integrase/recombinase XerD
MANLKLRYLVQDVDRHGNVRSYVRLPGKPKVRIRGLPGSEEFMAAYQAALSGIDSEKRRQYQRAVKGSFGYLCLAYYDSGDFKRLDRATQSWQRRALDRICQNNAHKPVALMTRKHVKHFRDDLAQTPSQSQKLLKALRALLRWAYETGQVPDEFKNPTADVKAIKYATSGHHAWTPAEVKQFEQRHPIGTKARLAMALVLYTSWRREDAVRLGPQHIVEVHNPDGSTEKRVRYRQAKNEHRNPVDMDVPLHPDLAKIIEATPSGHLTFLVTAHGKTFTPAGFGN